MTPVRRVRECENPGFTVVGCFPRADGTWEIFGQKPTEAKAGKEPWERIMTWQLLRSVTRAGVKFELWDNLRKTFGMA